MENNDILKKIRYIFKYNDDEIVRLFEKGGIPVTKLQVNNWMKKDDKPEYVTLKDVELSGFLNGFIVAKRGSKEGDPMPNEKKINNNLILRKLKIALELRSEDVIALLDLANFFISKHELSAFFRKPTQKQYKECLDQVMRNFLHGLEIKMHGKDPVKD